MPLRAATLAALFVYCTSAAAAGPDEPTMWLKQRLGQIAGRRVGGRLSYVVADLKSGEVLAGHGEERTVPVASCVKLVTSSAALSLLGPEYRIKTVLYGARREGGVIEGDLYLKGHGDPTLREGHLWRMVQDLHDLGVREIRGGLVVDESYFDRHFLAPLFRSNRTDRHYRAPIGAVSVNENGVSARVFPGAGPGYPAQVILQPRSRYLKLVNRVRTVGPRRRTFIDVRTKAQGEATLVIVSGRMRVGHASKWVRRRIEHPGLLAGHTLLDLLTERGIKVAQERVKRGETPKGLSPLATRYSPPLAVLVRHMNKVSSNFVAEQLLKVLGAETHGTPGSSANGLKAVAQHLAKIGIAPGSYLMLNGSGLYKSNRFSPLQLVRLLRAAHQDFRYGTEFVSSLAVAGVDGTLGHRMARTSAVRHVRAKTGTLANVISLAGYAGAPSGRGPLVFAFLASELPSSRLLQARHRADEMARALVSYLER